MQRSHPDLLAPGIWRITTPLRGRPRHVHAYLVGLADGGWMLVDGGADTGESWTVLDAGVRETAGDWSGVRLQVITHMHSDHIGLAHRVHKATVARSLMHALDAERAAGAAADPRGEAEYRASVLRLAGAPPELWDWARRRTAPARIPESHAFDGEAGTIPGAPGWRWIWTPEHTAGHISLVRNADGVLIAGDAVLPAITPTLGVNRQRDDPIEDYLGALRRVEAANVRLALPGHGAPIRSPDDRVAELRNALEAESGDVATLLSDRPLTAWEVAAARYAGRDLPSSAWIQALRETLAHLNHLELIGGARRERSGGEPAGFVRI